MKSRLPGTTLILFCLAALGACAVEPARETTGTLAPVTSVEVFLPENVRTIFKRSCESCHGHDGHGITGVAPDMLRSFGHTAEEWQSYFINPQGLHPGAQMPSTMWQSQDEIKTIAAFLASMSTQPPTSIKLP